MAWSCLFDSSSCVHGVDAYITNGGDDIYYWFCQCMCPADQQRIPATKLLTAGSPSEETSDE